MSEDIKILDRKIVNRKREILRLDEDINAKQRKADNILTTANNAARAIGENLRKREEELKQGEGKLFQGEASIEPRLKEIKELEETSRKGMLQVTTRVANLDFGAKKLVGEKEEVEVEKSHLSKVKKELEQDKIKLEEEKKKFNKIDIQQQREL